MCWVKGMALLLTQMVDENPMRCSDVDAQTKYFIPLFDLAVE